MKINPAALDQLREQTKRRDQAAFALGVALAEYELAKAAIYMTVDTVARDERLLRLGAVQDEFDGYRDTHMKIIVQSRTAQKSIGDAALRQLGLDSVTQTFTIDERTGEVLELIAGNYVPVMGAA